MLLRGSEEMSNILYDFNIYLMFYFSSFFRTVNTLLTKRRKNRVINPNENFLDGLSEVIREVGASRFQNLFHTDIAKVR